eukprot:scaffold121408_cov30-Tisochrysis_lutea.AAC.17
MDDKGGEDEGRGGTFHAHSRRWQKSAPILASPSPRPACASRLHRQVRRACSRASGSRTHSHTIVPPHRSIPPHRFRCDLRQRHDS